MTQFETMGISPSILQAIQEIGQSAPNILQEKAIPEILAGKDLLGQSATGTSLTFGVPMLQKAATDVRGIHGLILTPTPEICLQVTQTLRALAKHSPEIRVVAVYGGQPIERQIAELREVPHIVVGTPARLLEHLDRGTIRLYHVRLSVLDHTSTMLDMGFQDELESILDQVPSGRQTLIFSETMPTKVMNLAAEYLQNPVHVDVVPTEDLPVPVVEKPIVPTVAKASEPQDKTEALIKTIKNTVEEGGLDIYTALVDRISETMSPRIVAAALLKLHLGGKSSVPSDTGVTLSGFSFTREDLDQASIRPGKIRLVLNVGRRDGVSVKEVLTLFATETGLTSYFLGDIVLADMATYVDVPEDKLPVVFKGLNGIVHNETPLEIRLVHKVRDAAQLQRDMAEQRSRRPEKRFDGGDRRPQNNRRFPPNNNNGNNGDRAPRENAPAQAPTEDSAAASPVAPKFPEKRYDTDRERKPRDNKYTQGRSDNYRKPSSGLPPYFPASSVTKPRITGL